MGREKLHRLLFFFQDTPVCDRNTDNLTRKTFASNLYLNRGLPTWSSLKWRLVCCYAPVEYCMRDYIYWHLILYVDSRERETFVENSSYTVIDRGSLIQQRLRAVKRKIFFEQGFLVI